MTKFGIVVFPGSNCDADCYYTVKDLLGAEARYLWHKETSLGDVDVVVLPGGFSYGDYLRCGAIAKFSPIMKEVINFANKGGKVLGICNGFQILVESGLLPGVLVRNKNLKFICDTVTLKLKNNQTPFTKKGTKDGLYQIPIAHMEGNYFIDNDGLKSLQDNDQIVVQYSSATGEVNAASNPNGAINNIAGICNQQKNVFGLMPHPERVSESLLGKTDGRFIFESLL